MLGWGDSPVVAWHLGLAALLGLYTMKRRCSKRKWCRSSAHIRQVSQGEIQMKPKDVEASCKALYMYMSRNGCRKAPLWPSGMQVQKHTFDGLKTQNLQAAHVKQKEHEPGTKNNSALNVRWLFVSG